MLARQNVVGETIDVLVARIPSRRVKQRKTDEDSNAVEYWYQILADITAIDRHLYAGTAFSLRQ